MKALKKGIALIMLTLVMLVGSVAQTFAASAQTVQPILTIELPGKNIRPEPIKIPSVPFPLTWRVENKASSYNKGHIDFRNGQRYVPFILDPNQSIGGNIPRDSKEALVLTIAPATLTIAPR